MVSSRRAARTSKAAGASAAADGRRAIAAQARRNRTRVVAGVGAAMLGAAWWGFRWPWLLAGVAALVGFAWLARGDPDPSRWWRGSVGEVRTASMLARLPNRFVVLHDLRIPGWGGNVDHVVVGPTGIWVVDSKVRRARIHLRRGKVWAGDYLVDVEPVARQSAALESLLGRAVSPVVALHGHGLRRRGKMVGRVLVLPASRLVKRLRRRRRGWPGLPRRDVATVAVQVRIALSPAIQAED